MCNTRISVLKVWHIDRYRHYIDIYAEHSDKVTNDNNTGSV